ncbi:MAG: hypothetical protein BVN30_08120 [Proteobacteria bacterium ST_bin16]|nr:MAG: hypothetical protein BVN30_08120 [Proteobacteria bacterium ST_bin16]
MAGWGFWWLRQIWDCLACGGYWHDGKNYTVTPSFWRRPESICGGVDAMHGGVDVDTGLRRYDGWRGEGCGGCNGMVIMVVAADLDRHA